MEPQFNDEVTEDQKKEVGEALKKARRNLLFVGFKFVIGLFTANFLCAVLCSAVLKDVEQEAQDAFQFFATTTNIIFMAIYLNRHVKANSDILSAKIKEILKK